MPLPTTWHPVPHVGAVRDQGSGPPPCAHPPVGRLLWGRPFAHRHGHPLSVRHVQRGHVRDLSVDAAATSLPRHAHGAGAGQCPRPPRGPAQPVASKVSRRAHPAISTAGQSAAGPVERVWKLARRLATHNRFFATLDDVLTAVALCFDRWRTPNSVLRRLCGRSEDDMFNGSSSPIPTAAKAADRPTTPSTPFALRSLSLPAPYPLAHTSGAARKIPPEPIQIAHASIRKAPHLPVAGGTCSMLGSDP